MLDVAALGSRCVLRSSLKVRTTSLGQEEVGVLCKLLWRSVLFEGDLEYRHRSAIYTAWTGVKADVRCTTS